MKLQNEKQLFDMFVNKGDMRKHLQSPWHEERNGKIVASDGRILIAVDASYCEGEYEKRQELLPNMIMQLNNPLNMSKLHVEHIRAAIGEVGQEHGKKIVYRDVECPECEGSGRVLVFYNPITQDEMIDIEVECPVCDGSGRVTEHKVVETEEKVIRNDRLIQIDGSKFAPRYIAIILSMCDALGVKEIGFNGSGKRGNLFLLNEGVEIILMPCVNDELECVIVETREKGGGGNDYDKIRRDKKSEHKVFSKHRSQKAWVY